MRPTAHDPPHLPTRTHQKPPLGFNLPVVVVDGWIQLIARRAGLGLGLGLVLQLHQLPTICMYYITLLYSTLLYSTLLYSIHLSIYSDLYTALSQLRCIALHRIGCRLGNTTT